jgi:hypothetical protein
MVFEMGDKDKLFHEHPILSLQAPLKDGQSQSMTNVGQSQPGYFPLNETKLFSILANLTGRFGWK